MFNAHVNAPLEQSQVTCANPTDHPGPGERLKTIRSSSSIGDGKYLIRCGAKKPSFNYLDAVSVNVNRPI